MIWRTATAFLLVASWTSTTLANHVSAESCYNNIDGSTSYYREICVGVEGAVNVQVYLPGASQWEDFQYDSWGDQWWIEAEAPTVSDLNEATSGEFLLRVEMPAGHAVYSFDVNGLEASDFPVLPQVAPLPASVPSDYTYRWSWTGNAADVDGMGVELWIGEEGHEQYYEDYTFAGTLSLADLSWQPAGVTATGPAGFCVAYGIADSGQLANWAFNSGESTIADVFDFAGDDEWEDWIVSQHEVSGFQVVPEPATAVLLLCGLAVLWQRNFRTRA